MRRTDIDVLRIVLCAGVIVAHALLIFAVEPRYHLKSAQPDMVALGDGRIPAPDADDHLVSCWRAGPPLKSLRSRGALRFVGERVDALPGAAHRSASWRSDRSSSTSSSATAAISAHGLRLVAPLQESFFEFFPNNLKFLKLLTWSHLYFLAYLFLMSVLKLLPLLMRLVKRAREPQRAAGAGWPICRHCRWRRC